MRLLFVSPWLPYPEIPHAGGQSLYHILRSLADRGHQLHLLCYGRQEPRAAIDAVQALCRSLTVITPAYRWMQKARQLLHDGWRHPWSLGQRTHRQMRESIGALCREQAIDVVHLAWTEMGRYLPAVPGGVGTVLGTQDVEYLVRPREVRLYPFGAGRWQAARRARLLIDGERDYVHRAAAVLASSPADRLHLATLGDPDRVSVFYPWIDIDAMRAVGSASLVPGRLTYVGALDRVANVAAVRFLIDAVWPVVRTTHPAATLRIVGASPPLWLCHAASADNRLSVTGFVPDMAAEWAAADIAVSPSLIGGGLLVKVAQPMAAGRPVVTTAPGNEGVGAAADAVEVADDAPSFARAVLRLLDDRSHWEALRQAGRRHVLDRLDWCANIDNLEAVYTRCIAPSSRL